LQSTDNILLIRPAHFGFNSETAASNSFQQSSFEEGDTVARKALEEFDNFANALRTHGVNVFIFNDTDAPAKPDAIFPNNWVTFHEDGTVVLYPMCTPNRRIERRPDIIDNLQQQFRVNNIIDLSHYENDNKFLEGTGSIVFDHRNRIAYAALSPRTNKEVFIGLCAQPGYSPVSFHAYNAQRQEIYHTNVMMCITDRCCIICSESITDEAERKSVLDSLSNTAHDIIEISKQQMNSFAGNMLAVLNNKSEQLLVLSQTAFNSLSQQQKEKLGQYATLIPIPIPTIETIGGGSARCMMAEIFLPLK